MKNETRKAPAPVIRRLSNYHHLLVGLQQTKLKTISSTTLAQMLEYTPIQVRKDLHLTGLPGRPKTGFRVDALTEAIRTFLGWSDNCTAVLFGAGHLGSALMKYPWHEGYGIRIIAAFDQDKKRSDVHINDIPVYHNSQYQTVVKRRPIDIGIIAVPGTAAQEVADFLAGRGVKGLWNFSPTHLKTTPSVAVVDAFFTQSLALLTRRLVESRSEQ